MTRRPHPVRRAARPAAAALVLAAGLAAATLIDRSEPAPLDEPVLQSRLEDAVAELVVSDAPARQPYSREEFGQRWADVDRNGCDQRNDSLARALTDVTHRPGTNDCVVEAGTLVDLYTGTQVSFQKGPDGGGVDIDHVVPLAHAWDAGAWTWDAATRERFANDLSNLQPTTAKENRSKGDQDITQWLPPDRSYTCPYVARWIEIKVRWDLTVTTAERDLLLSLAQSCA